MLVPFLLSARPTQAGSTASKERTARTACLAGDYTRGVQLLSELFVSTMDPTFIYNQGRCFEQNRRYEDAIARFQEYLRAGRKLSKADQADAHKHIHDCKELLASQPSQPPATATVAVAVPGPVAPLGAAATPVSTPAVAGQPAVQPATFVSAPAAPVGIPTLAPVAPPVTPDVSTKPAPLPSNASQDSGLRVAGIVCAAVGLVAVGTGFGLALETQSMSSDAEKKGGGTQAQEDRRKTLETWGWVSYGVGAAAIATGVILCVVGWPRDHSTNVALLPALAPDGASMILRGSF